MLNIHDKSVKKIVLGKIKESKDNVDIHLLTTLNETA